MRMFPGFHIAGKRTILLPVCCGLAALVAVALPVAIGLGRAAAQQASDPDANLPRLEFEVASVRPGLDFSSTAHRKLGVMYGNPPIRSGLFTANTYLFDYIQFAYQIPNTEIQTGLLTQKLLPVFKGAPGGGMLGGIYSIEARAEGVPTREQMRRMVRSLLADRFKLKAHYETRQGPIYKLVVDTPGKLGPQLHVHSASKPCIDAESKEARNIPPEKDNDTTYCGQADFGADGNHIQHLTMVDGTMSDVVNQLFKFGGQGDLDHIPIVDETGLKGRYDMQLDFRFPKLLDPQEGVEGQPLISAIKKQLGLRLVKSTGPVKVLVIDHVERPTEN